GGIGAAAGVFTAKLPFVTQEYPAGLIGLAGLFMGDKNALPFLMRGVGGQAWSGLFLQGELLMGAAALAAVLAVLVLALSLFSFFNLKPLTIAVVVCSGLGILVTLAGLAIAVSLHRQNNVFFTGTVGPGVPVACLAFAVTGVLNALLAKKGVPVEYAEGDYERAQIYAKVKRGEVQLADLPYPIVETAETREMEEKIAKETGGVQA
ncbi:MAG: hypothetical protein LBB50_02405, partial [Oscillospiraceae bacterium]|nr:hypothetical protein [Oscillospiraceae bacterium]